MIANPFSGNSSPPLTKNISALRFLLGRRKIFMLLMLALSGCAGFSATNVVQTNDPLCAVPAIANYKQGPGTLRMIARLQAILKATDPLTDPFLNNERVQIFERAQASATNALDLLARRVRYASELLRAGRSADATMELDAIAAFVSAHQIR